MPNLSSFERLSNSAGSFADFVYIILHKDVQTFPERGANTTALAATIDPVTGEGFVKIPVTKVAGSKTIEGTAEGNEDGSTKKYEINTAVPGNDPVVSAALEKFDGKECVILIPLKGKCSDGTMRSKVIGCKCGGIVLKVSESMDGTNRLYKISGTYETEGLLDDYDKPIQTI